MTRIKAKGPIAGSIGQIPMNLELFTDFWSTRISLLNGRDQKSIYHPILYPWHPSTGQQTNSMRCLIHAPTTDVDHKKYGVGGMSYGGGILWSLHAKGSRFAVPTARLVNDLLEPHQRTSIHSKDIRFAVPTARLVNNHSEPH